ncbi:MAG: ATP-binding cassette domain-containing protein [Bacteroidota bacterium]|nr:ATP-binding cassette domain-containing protein [Bacteroidota bacterium]
MKIRLTNVGKRFNREWIFRHLNIEFSSAKSYAIIGPNGSGKSTLLQIIAGAVLFNEGEIEYYLSEQKIESEKIYAHISIAAPYLELVEEMTLIEFLHFHSALKPLLPNITSQQIISILHLNDAAQKQIRYFSSGMKQRVKLAQAIFSNTQVVLLDEPCTNLDDEGIALYKNLVNTYCKNRLLIISSNDKQEYNFCEKMIDMKTYKFS